MTSPRVVSTPKDESSSFFAEDGRVFRNSKSFDARAAEALSIGDERLQEAAHKAMVEKHEKAQQNRNSNLQRRREYVASHHRKIEEARRAMEGRVAMEAEELLQRHNAKQGSASRRRRMSNERIRLARAAHHRKVSAKRSEANPPSSPEVGMDRIQLKLARAERNRRRLHERRQRRAVERFEAGRARTLKLEPGGGDAAGEEADDDDDAPSKLAQQQQQKRRWAVAVGEAGAVGGQRGARQRQAVRLQVLRRRMQSHNSRAAERRAQSLAARLIQAWYRCVKAGLPFDATASFSADARSPSPSPPTSPRHHSVVDEGAATEEGVAAAMAAVTSAPNSPGDAAADSPASPPRRDVPAVPSEAFDRLAATLERNNYNFSSACSNGGGGSGSERKEPCSVLKQMAARRIQGLLRRGLHGLKVANALLRSVEAVSALSGASEAMATATYDEAINTLSGRGLQQHCEAVLRALRMGKEMRHVPPSVRSAKAFLSALLINAFPVTSLDDELPSPGAAARYVARQDDHHPLALEKARLARAAGNAIEALVALDETLASVAEAVRAPSDGSGSGGVGVSVDDFRRLGRAARRTACARVAFCLRFAEWKLKDAARLAEEMTLACVDVLLMQLRAERDLRAAAVRYGLDTADDASLFRTGFEQIKEGTSRQLGKMLAALCKLVGRDEARRRVDEATDMAFDRLALDEPLALEEEYALAEEVRAMEERETARVNGLRAGVSARRSSPSGTDDGSGANAAALAAPDVTDDFDDEEDEAGAAAAGVAGGAARPLSAGDLLSNEWLVHEVMMSETPLQVTLEEAHENRLIGDRGAAADDAYWQGVAARFASGDLTPLLEFVAELRDKIVGLTPRRRDLAAETSEAMDVELLEQMMAHGAFDHGVFFRMVAFAGERILELEAPVRNDSTRAKLAEWEAASRGVVAAAAAASASEKEQSALLSAEVVRDCFEFLLGKTDEIHVDILNAHLQFVTPFLKQNGVEYERDRFTEKLDLGEVTLDLTHMWLHRAVKRARKAAAANDAAAASLLDRLEKRHGDSYLQLIRAALVDEVLGSIVRVEGPAVTAVTAAVSGNAAPPGGTAAAVAAAAAAAAAEDDGIAMPETLAHDQYRLVVIAAAAEQVAYTAAMLAYARQTLAASRVALTKPEEEAGRRALMVLFETDDVAGADICAQVVEIARGAAKRAGRPLPAAAAEALATRVGNVLADGACPAYRLYLKRVLNMAKAVLQASKLDEPAFRELLRGAGLAEYQEAMIEKVAKPLLIIERHNESVFAPYYNEIIPLAMRTSDDSAIHAHQAAMDVD